jgi:hypothetical protein
MTLVGAQSAETSPPAKTQEDPLPDNYDEIDFDRYQRAVISINRRLDAMEATLGGLAILEIGAMTYILEKLQPEIHWTVGVFVAMALAIGLALLGVLEFQGDEAPNLFEFDAVRRVNRQEALAATIKTMSETYHFNTDQVGIKEKLRSASAALAGLVLALFAAHTVGWIR